MLAGERDVRLRHGLKGERCGHAVLVAAERVGQRGPTPGDAVIVEERERDAGDEGERGDKRGLAKAREGTELRREVNENGESHRDGFERPGEHLQREAETEERGVANAPERAQTRERTEDETTGASGNRAAPIGVRPDAQRAELNDGENSAEQRPARRRPSAQHPITKRAERGAREQNAGPGKAEQQLAGGESEALADGVDGTVRRLLQDVDGFKELA